MLGIRSHYSIQQLKDSFFKKPKLSKSMTSDSKDDSKTENDIIISENPIISNQNNDIIINPITMSEDRNNNKLCETLKCSTCNASPCIDTPEKDHLNEYNYIFDLNHLPIFDENTGEFFWTSSESNWRKAKESIIKTDELGFGKSLSLNHGSLVSLSTSFVGKVQTDDFMELDKINQEKSEKTKKDANSATFMEELNNLLKNL